MGKIENNQAEIAKKLFRDFWTRARNNTLKYSYEDLLQLIFICAANGRNFLEIHQERIDEKSIKKLQEEKFIVELYKSSCRIVIPI